MKCVARRSLVIPALVCAALLAGCLPGGESQVSEEKEPFFVRGSSRMAAMDYQGAIENFEKALEVNPRSASAHFQLATLYEQTEKDPAAAIFHYSRYLRYRPNALNADIVKQRVHLCKQEIARTVSLGPVTQELQRTLDKLHDDNRRMSEELKRLTDENSRLRAAFQPAPTNAPVAQTPAPRAREATPPAQRPRETTPPSQPTPRRSTYADSGSSSGGASASRSTPSPTPSYTYPRPSRYHTVRPGDTMKTIARQYGIKVETLQAANPSVDSRRMPVGKPLRIP